MQANSPPYTRASGLKPLRRFFNLLAPDKKSILYIYIYAIFSGLIRLALPLGIQAIVNFIQGGQVSSSWAILVFIVILSVGLFGGLQIMQLIITENILQKIFARSAFEFAYRIPRIKMESVFRQYMPELTNRFFDTITVQKGLPKVLIDFSTSLLQMIFGLALLSFYHPFFVTYGLLLLVVLYLIYRLLWNKGLMTSLEESKYKYQVAYWLEEVARTMTSFKLTGGTEFPMEKTDYSVTNYIIARRKHFRVLITQYGFSIAYNIIVVAGLLILGGLLVINQQMNIAQFIAADIVIILVMTSTEKLIMSLATVYDVVTALEKIGQLTDKPLDDEGGTRFEVVDTGAGINISVDGLSYSYPNSSAEVITNLTFNIQPREKICISGFSEAGKSTLIRLLAGLYPKHEGTIAYNQIPVKSFAIERLHYYVGENLEKTDIFYGTLMENITLGRQEVTHRDVLWVLNELKLMDFIKTLPDGLQAMLTSAGSTLPDSIRRKILLARSAVNKPELLLLEDPVAFLNRSARSGVSRFLCSQKNSWTLVGVSNDPIFASYCDRCIVLQEGQLLASGPFDSLKEYDWFEEIYG